VYPYVYQTFPPVAAINEAASKPSVKAGGSNKLKAIPIVAAVNQTAQVKTVVKGAEQKKYLPEGSLMLLGMS